MKCIHKDKIMSGPDRWDQRDTLIRALASEVRTPVSEPRDGVRLMEDGTIVEYRKANYNQQVHLNEVQITLIANGERDARMSDIDDEILDILVDGHPQEELLRNMHIDEISLWVNDLVDEWNITFNEIGWFYKKGLRPVECRNVAYDLLRIAKMKNILAWKYCDHPRLKFDYP